LLELLLELLSGEREELSGPDSSESRIASRIRHILNSYSEMPMNESGSIEEALEKNGRSYAHQCRIFKKHYGVSPLIYVNALRAERAKNLLNDTGFGVSEIAYKLGFENLGYFTRFFKKYTGTSPSAFRRA
jgi:AraC-like DNA-binding protein